MKYIKRFNESLDNTLDIIEEILLEFTDNGWFYKKSHSGVINHYSLPNIKIILEFDDITKRELYSISMDRSEVIIDKFIGDGGIIYDRGYHNTNYTIEQKIRNLLEEELDIAIKRLYDEISKPITYRILLSRRKLSIIIDSLIYLKPGGGI